MFKIRFHQVWRAVAEQTAVRRGTRPELTADFFKLIGDRSSGTKKSSSSRSDAAPVEIPHAVREQEHVVDQKVAVKVFTSLRKILGAASAGHCLTTSSGRSEQNGHASLSAKTSEESGQFSLAAGVRFGKDCFQLAAGSLSAHPQ